MMFGLPGPAAALAVAALLLSASHSSVSMAAETCVRRQEGARGGVPPRPLSPPRGVAPGSQEVFQQQRVHFSAVAEALKDHGGHSWAGDVFAEMDGG